MSADDLAYTSIAELGRRYRTRELTPVEVVDALLERIERLEPLVNAFTTVMDEQLRRQAREAERQLRDPEPLGPLHGIPVSVKDNIATSGMPTTAGSRVLADWVPDRDAACVTTLRQAGALLTGKVNLFEFAFGEAHDDYGHVRNPWRLDRSTGGSSSGSAASVAAGMSHGSIGTDAGGSIRVPAALCGIVGLKPTYDRIPGTGTIPSCGSLSHVGPIARTVEDAALLFDALADDAAACSIDDAIAGLCLAVAAPQVTETIDPEVQTAFEATSDALRGAGATLRTVGIPDLRHFRAVLWTIASAEAADVHRDWLATQAGDYHPVVRGRLESGKLVPATAYVRAQRIRLWLARALDAALDQVDALLLPVSPTTAYPLGARQVEIDGRTEPVAQAVTRYTPLASVVGWPALSVPCGFSRDGLPIGFQVVGRPGDEATVLRIGRAYERVTEWHRRHPPIPLDAVVPADARPEPDPVARTGA